MDYTKGFIGAVAGLLCIFFWPLVILGGLLVIYCGASAMDWFTLKYRAWRRK